MTNDFSHFLDNLFNICYFKHEYFKLNIHDIDIKLTNKESRLRLCSESSRKRNGKLWKESKKGTNKTN